jgi:hemoglobin
MRRRCSGHHPFGEVAAGRAHAQGKRMTDVPTLYDWIGGGAALRRLTTLFYAKIAKDEMLAPVFAKMGPDHPAHVAEFIGEVLGGPPLYSSEHGGHPEMIRHHLGRRLSEAQRRHWLALLLDSYTELGLPSDPEFASALVSYLEWGNRLAVINSQPGVEAPLHAPMPKWGWGEVKGPYRPKE